MWQSQSPCFRFLRRARGAQQRPSSGEIYRVTAVFRQLRMSGSIASSPKRSGGSDLEDLNVSKSGRLHSQ